MKNIQFYTNGELTVEWNKDKCMHQGKCLRTLPYVVDKPGVYHIRVSDREIQQIRLQADFCPAGAMTVRKNQNED